MNKILAVALLTLIMITLMPGLKIVSTPHAATNSYTLRLTLEGATNVLQVKVWFSNGTYICLNSSTTINFTYHVYVEVNDFQCPGYYYTVNGTKYYRVYPIFVNQSETLVIDIVPICVTVNLNLTGKGFILMSFDNHTTLVLNHSISFRTLNGTQITMCSPYYIIVNGEKTPICVLTLTNATNNLNVEITDEPVYNVPINKTVASIILSAISSLLANSSTTSASSPSTPSSATPSSTYQTLGIFAIILAVAAISAYLIGRRKK